MYNSTKKLFLTSLVTFTLLASASAEDYVVVVNKNNKVNLTVKNVSRIFLGKMKSFPGGGQAVPIIQKSASDISKKFIKKILRKRAAQYKSYWSKMVFTGKGNPPKEVENDDKTKELLSKNPNAIGIIKASAVDDSVRVITKF